MMASKMILTWGGEDILSSSIELFLAKKSNWQVKHLSGQDDPNQLLEAVYQSKPDIVIIHQVSRNHSINLPSQLLQIDPCIKVIVISLEDNLMDIYTKQKMLVNKATDLITFIDNEQ